MAPGTLLCAAGDSNPNFSRLQLEVELGYSAENVQRETLNEMF